MATVRMSTSPRPCARSCYVLHRRSWTELGGGDFGWLKAKHHISFAGHGVPDHGPLGALIVWNDDESAPGTGFPLHRHENVEIITYVRQGIVAHEDDRGNAGRIEAGDVQVISAGTDIRHAEFNRGREPLKIAFRFGFGRDGLAASRVGRPGHFRKPDNPAASLFSPAAFGKTKALCRFEPVQEYLDPFWPSATKSSIRWQPAVMPIWRSPAVRRP